MQRRPSLLRDPMRRAAALRQAPPLSSAQVRAPPPTPIDPLYHTPGGASAEKKPKGLVQPNDGATKSHVSGSEKVSDLFFSMCVGRISPQMRLFQQPSDVNFMLSIPKNG